MNLNGTTVFGHASHTTTKPSAPSDPSSGVAEHNIAGQHLLQVPEARRSSYWDILDALRGLS